MSRSLKKGPFIEPKLLKRIEAMNQKNEKQQQAKGSENKGKHFPYWKGRGKEARKPG